MSKKLDFFDNAESSTTPTVGNISASDLVTYANDAAYEAGEAGSPVNGNIYFNTTSNIIRYYNGTSWLTITDLTTFNAHATDTTNPHSVTKTQVGLGNVDNTSDVDKPVSTAQQTALDLKLDKTGGTISSNLIISGDLTVNGTTTNINTTDMDVTDKNITVNNGGSDASSEGAGLTVERVGTDGSIVYEDALTSKFKVGALGSEKEIVDVSSSQVLTEKDIDGGTASNTSRMTMPKDTTANLALLTDKQGTVAYDTTLGSLVINDGTGWTQLTGGGGTSVGTDINYVTNPTFEDDVNDVTVTTGVTKVQETVAPIRDTGSLKLTYAATATTASNADIELDTFDGADTDVSKALTISFEIDTSDANYTSDDIEVVIRDNTNNVDIPLIHDTSGLVKSHSTIQKFTARFYTVTGVTDYSLRLQSNVVRSNIAIIYVDNVKVGPDVIVPGSIVTEWQDYTPAWTAITTDPVIGNGTIHGKWRRVGDSMECQIQIVVGSTTTYGVSSYLFGIADSKVIDTGKIPGTANGEVTVLGSANGLDSGTLLYGGYVTYKSTTTVGINSDSATTAWQSSLPHTWANGDKIGLSFKVPIVGWSSGAMISTTESLIDSYKAIYYASTGTSCLNNNWTTIDFDTKDNSTIDGQVTTGASWSFMPPKKGYYTFVVAISFGAFTAGTGEAYLALFNTVGTLVRKGERQAIDNTFQGFQLVTTMYLDPANANDIIRARMYQSNGANRTCSTAIANTSISIKYEPDFTSFSVFGETEILEVKNTTLTTYTIAVNTWGDLTSIELSPGEWDITALCEFVSNGATTTDRVFIGLSQTSGNSTTGLENGYNRCATNKDTTSLTYNNLSIPKYNITLTSTTTIYLKAKADTSITNLQSAYSISARRIK